MTKNAAVLLALRDDLIPTETNIESTREMLAELVGDGSDTKFREAVYKYRDVLGRDIGTIEDDTDEDDDESASDSSWADEPDNDKFLSIHGNGPADTLVELKRYAREQHELFNELYIQLAKINAWDGTHLREAEIMSQVDITAGNLTPLLPLLGITGATSLNQIACDILIKAAQKKAQALRTAPTKEAAIANAEDVGRALPAMLVQADAAQVQAAESKAAAYVAFTAAKGHVDVAKSDVNAAEKALWTIFNREGTSQAFAESKEDLAAVQVTLAEIETAYELASKQAAIAEEKAAFAHQAAQRAAIALDSARAANHDPDAIKSAEAAQADYLKATHAVDAAGTAARAALLHRQIAENPMNPAHKLKRANFLMEQDGLLGFVDEIMREGGDTPKAADNSALLSIQQGRGVRVQGVKLRAGDTIHATQKVGGLEIRLVQDSQGKVTDQSSKGLEPSQQAMAAMKQAKMLLLNYKPENGDIFIRGGTALQANRVYAALLLLSQNNPDIQLTSSDIKSNVVGCDGPGMFETHSGFINKYLGGLHQGARDRELATMIGQQKSMKEKFQGLVSVETLPEGIEFKIR